MRESDESDRADEVPPESSEDEPTADAQAQDSTEDESSQATGDASPEAEVAAETGAETSRGDQEQSEEAVAADMPEPELPMPTPEELTDLRKKAEERDEYIDKFQRARADYMNYQERSRKERELWRELATQDFAESVLPVIDDLSRVIAVADEAHDFQQLLEGIGMVRDSLYKVFSTRGIEPIDTDGKPFDPALHEAVMQEVDEERPEGSIAAELREGFTLKGRVLRPSQVKVSKRPDKPQSQGDPASEDTPEAEESEAQEATEASDDA